MSFTKTMYDDCAYNSGIQMNSQISDYTFNPPAMTTPCIPDTPLIIVQSGSDSIKRALTARAFTDGAALQLNADANLRGLGQVASHCPATKYSPLCSSCGVMNSIFQIENGVCGNCRATLGMSTQVNYSTCHFGVEVSRDSYPSGAIRGVDTMRLDPICFNPQEILFGRFGQYNQNARQQALDNYQSCGPAAGQRRA